MTSNSHKKDERQYAKDRMEYFREFHRVIAPVIVRKKDWEEQDK